MKYRKKVAEVEAIQFTGDNALEVINWAHDGLPPEANSIVTVQNFKSGKHNLLNVLTRVGIRTAYVYDFIIRDSRGYSVIRPDDFEIIYEVIE